MRIFVTIVLGMLWIAVQLPAVTPLFSQDGTSDPPFDGAVALATERGWRTDERIVFVGDSITMQGGYVELIAKALSGRPQTHPISVTRYGLNGGRVPDMTLGKTPWGQIKPFSQILEEDKPTIIVLFIGINDVMHTPGTSPEAFEQGLTEMVELAQKSEAAVILATAAVNGESFDPKHESQVKLEGYCELTRKVAKKSDSKLCDLRRAFVETLEQQHASKRGNGYLTYDGVHMTEIGNQLIASQMARALTEVLRARPK